MKFNFKKYALISLAAAGLITAGCSKDYLETRPSSNISVDDLTSNTTGLNTLLNGIHTLFTDPGASYDGRAYDWGQKSIDMGMDLMGEDVVATQSPYDWFVYYYQYVATEAANYWMPYHLWRFYYRIINNANQILDAVDNAVGPDSEKKSLKGQALAYRAFAYFKLVNSFSDHIQSPNGAQALGVPIYLTATKGDTKFPGRGTVQNVYDQIFADLDEAYVQLTTGAATKFNKSHIDQYVVAGIKARVYLTAGRNAEAAQAADDARANSTLMSAQQLLTSGFNSSLNPEFMWTSQLTSEQANARGLSNFMSWMDEETPGYANVGALRKISRTLYELIDPTDVRKQQFRIVVENGTTLYKHKKFFVVDPTGYDYQDLLMRASEMYLIRAEALARINPTDPVAIQELNDLMAIRQPGYDATTSISNRNIANPVNKMAKGLLGMAETETWTLLEEVKLQRKIELWGEGFSYDDIRRYQKGLNRPRNYNEDHTRNVTNGVLSLGANDKKFLFRIPQNELDNNPNMVPNP